MATTSKPRPHGPVWLLVRLALAVVALAPGSGRAVTTFERPDAAAWAGVAHGGLTRGEAARGAERLIAASELEQAAVPIFGGAEIANALSAMERDPVPSGFAVGPATLGLEPLRGPPVAKRGVLTLYGLALVYEARAHQDPARRETKTRIGGLELFDAGNASSVRTLSLGIAEGSGDWGWENAVGLGVWYDPETGSFVSADPLGFPDSMNQYAWGVGNYWKADPLGLAEEGAAGFWASAGAWGLSKLGLRPSAPNPTTQQWSELQGALPELQKDKPSQQPRGGTRTERTVGAVFNREASAVVGVVGAAGQAVVIEIVIAETGGKVIQIVSRAGGRVLAKGFKTVQEAWAAAREGKAASIVVEDLAVARTVEVSATGTRTARAGETLPSSSSGVTPDYGSGRGRRGSPQVRAHVDAVRDQFLEANPGYRHVGGGTDRVTGAKVPEEFLPGPGGSRKGASFPDLTFEAPDGTRIRINTVDTYSDGAMTVREQTNFDRIFEQTAEPVIAIPKPHTP